MIEIILNFEGLKQDSLLLSRYLIALTYSYLKSIRTAPRNPWVVDPAAGPDSDLNNWTKKYDSQVVSKNW